MEGVLQMHSADAHTGALKILGFPLGANVKLGIQPGPFASLLDELTTSLKLLHTSPGFGA